MPSQILLSDAQRLEFTSVPKLSANCKSSRQSAFLNANALLHPDKFEVVRGKYINKTILVRCDVKTT